MSKWLVKLLVCIMVFSVVVPSIPHQQARAEEQIQPENQYISISLSQDIQVIDDQGFEQATLIKGSEHLAYIKDEDIFINWFGNVVRLDQSDIGSQLDAEEPPVQELEMVTVTAENPLTVERVTGEQLAIIAQGANFQIVEEFDDYYLTVLNGEEIKIKKKQALNENQQKEELESQAGSELGPESSPEEQEEKEASQAEGEENQEVKEDLQNSTNEHEEASEQSEPKNSKTEERTVAVTVNSLSFDDHFQVNVDKLPFYDKSTGSLVEAGYLKKGQVFPRTRDYTSWHAITIGNKTAYVPKDGTSPATGETVKNQVGSLNSINLYINFNVDTVVYDNSSGRNVHFATVKKGVRMPVLKEYTNWYAIDLSGRIGYLQKKNVTAEFTESIKYFEVIQENTVGYKKVDGKLVEVTSLVKGQVYPRVADYTSWHEIKFGNGTIFVKKEGTRPASENMIKNENTGLKNSGHTVTIANNTSIYDNTSSSLVEFAVLYEGTKYPIISDHGKWLKIDFSGRIGYIKTSDTTIEFTQNVHYFTSSIANVPVYDNSSGSLKVVGYLRSGQVYHRTKDYTSWHEIQFNNKLAYVAKDSTIPVLRQTYNNPSDKYSSAGSFKTTKLTAIYYYVGKELVPFATIGPNQNYTFVEDRGSYVKVNFADRYGFVKKSDVTIQYLAGKDLVNPRVVYSYAQMSKDINEIVATYPGIATKHVIGKSVDGRNLYAVKLGKGSTEIMINGSHHAREYMTTNIVMEMLDQYSQAYVKNSKIDGYAVKSILDKTSIWFVPMVNPDGVTLVQQGHTSAKNPSQVLQINGGNRDFSAWKANIRGVDLNRQYPAGWNDITTDTGKPAPQNYKGQRPLSEPEAKAMYDFTNGRNFKTTVSYHSSGEILYWHFKQGTERTARDREIANMIKSKTGYSLVEPKANPSGGGYTDWFISEHLKPGFTPEISPYVGPRPVPIKSFDSIWTENKAIGVMLADEAYKNRNNR